MKRVVLFITIVAFITSATSAQAFVADAAESSIEWHGKKIGGDHSGGIALKSGEVSLEGDKLSGGTVIIDMTTISNYDIEKDNMKERLIGHLESDDFFSVETFPEASLVINSSKAMQDGKMIISSTLTIKGISKEQQFEAYMKNDSGLLKLSGTIEIDRTLFDVRYGSGKFFKDIGDRAINDIFSLNYELTFKKN